MPIFAVGLSAKSRKACRCVSNLQATSAEVEESPDADAKVRDAVVLSRHTEAVSTYAN